MRIIVLLFIFIFAENLYSHDFKLFGPRAGVGFLTNSDDDANLKQGFHTSFGWQLGLPYKANSFTGYAEGGINFLGIEQGKLNPHTWAYVGVHFEKIGFGAGPVINILGIGLGMNFYRLMNFDDINVPIGADVNFIENSFRVQFFIGYNFK